MSRGNSSIWRPVAVWSGVTAAAVAAAAAVPDAWTAAQSGPRSDAVADLFVAACGTGLALALAWLWVITTLTVAGILSGSARAGGGTTRRLVLLACGAAVLAGTGVPAMAAGGDGREVLVGLPLPERAVAPPQRSTAPPPLEAAPETPVETRVERPVESEVAGERTYVVRAGDSLWSIAQRHSGDSGSVDLRWRAIWQANRDVVGDDPDLILPGQVLRLPDGARHDHPHDHPRDNTHHHEDGDR